MSILDSVAGKGARLPLPDTAVGNVLDHGLDIVHPPLWYGAWAWGLGARTADDPLSIAAFLLIAFYVGDRLVLMVAKARFGRSEEHTSELQSLMRISYAVFCLKKKITNNNNDVYRKCQSNHDHHIHRR